MNALDTRIIESPYGKEDKCSVFEIDTVTSPYVLSDATIPGKQYTMHLWAKTDTTAGLTFGGSTFELDDTWLECVTSFTATSKNVRIKFNTPTTYYIYHPKLELGTLATDWSPAPEDSESDIQVLQESVLNLQLEDDRLSSEITTTTKKIDDVNKEYQVTKTTVSSLTQSAGAFSLKFKTIEDDGVSKLKTKEKGFTFNDEGMTVDDSYSDTKTVVNEKGMVVYDKTTLVDGEPAEVLTATYEGVIATDLKANTYLIIGGRSRFENFGTNRTGCFWIGGN